MKDKKNHDNDVSNKEFESLELAIDYVKSCLDKGQEVKDSGFYLWINTIGNLEIFEVQRDIFSDTTEIIKYSKENGGLIKAILFNEKKGEDSQNNNCEDIQITIMKEMAFNSEGNLTGVYKVEIFMQNSSNREYYDVPQIISENKIENNNNDSNKYKFLRRICKSKDKDVKIVLRHYLSEDDDGFSYIGKIIMHNMIKCKKGEINYGIY